MENLHIISIQHGYLFKKIALSSNIFDLATSLKDLIQNQINTPVSVDLQRFNISDVLFKLSWDDFALAVSSNRADLFFISKYAPDNDKNFNQIIGNIRSVMSSLFSYFNNNYGINKLGLVVNYMLCDTEMLPSKRINEVILDNRFSNKKFTVYSLEGQNEWPWKERTIFDVNRIWDAKYSVPNKTPVVNLGILRDVNINLRNNMLSDEEYNDFLQFVEPLFSFDAIKERVS